MVKKSHKYFYHTSKKFFFEKFDSVQYIILKGLPKHKHKSKGEAKKQKHFTKFELHPDHQTQTFMLPPGHLGG